MKKRTQIGLIAFSLAAIMFTQSLPMEILTVLAEGLTPEETIEREFYPGNMVDSYNIGGGYIIQENVENRTPTTKEFLMSDDTIMVQQFVEPVHYLENGEYKDIDNSLVEEIQNNKKVYQNTANSFKVKIAKEQNPFIEIEEDGYDFQFSYKTKSKQAVKLEINNSKKTEKIDYKGKDYTRPNANEVPKGEIRYNSIDSNTDMIHTVKNNKISNGIIISKSNEEYSYTFELKSENLTFKQKEDGSVYASNDIGQEKFVMPIPYMMNANGEYSNAITYTLNEADGKITLTLEADAEWINANAKFPITITPEIRSAKTNALEFANVYENGRTVISADKVYVGKKDDAERSDAFFNFKAPKVASYYELIGASVNFEYETQGMGLFDGKDLQYDVYLAESTNDLSSLTYENNPKEIQKLNGIKRNSQRASKTATYESDIINTNVIENDTITIGIETSAETSEDSYIALATASETTSALYWYQKTIGLEDEYSIESFGINGSTSHINNGTGQLTTVVDLASVNTISDMPFEASLIYNDYYDELLTDIANQTGKTIPAVAGPCFKLNVQQFMIKHDSVFELIDADGSISTFSPCTTRGIYYSREKKLYYDSTVQVAYDLQGNKMYFNNTGCLTKIVSENNPTEYINVVYTTTYGEVDKVEYYANSIKKYTIDFTYENSKLTTITTDADINTQYTIGLYYTDGNLTSIKNHTGNSIGVQTLSFGYCTRYLESDPVGMLNYMFDNQKSGIIFDRKSNDTIDQVRNINGANVYDDSRCNSYVAFDYYGIYTKIYYYENNVWADMKYVSFNNTKKVVSEWRQDSKGIVYLQATTNWRNANVETSDYIKESCSYYHRTKDGAEITINPNKEVQKDINANALEVSDNPNYRYAVIMKVATSDASSSIASGLHISVTIGNENAEHVILNQGGNTYVCIPCGYYSSNTTVKITNHGSEVVNIDYFYYALVDCVKEEYDYDSGINAHILTSTATNLRSGVSNVTTYDTKQRISTSRTKLIKSNSDQETTTYSYYDDDSATNIQKGKIRDIRTTNSSGVETEKAEYVYTGNWNNYTETVTTTQGTIKQQASYALNRESIPYTITQTDNNNVQTTRYYKVMNGDVRLWKIASANAREEYAYNNLGQITNINVYEGSNGTPVFSQTDNYDENGKYIGSSYGGIAYTYRYDETGIITSINQEVMGANDAFSTMLNYRYFSTSENISSNRISMTMYANGDSADYYYSQNVSSGIYTNTTQIDYWNANTSTSQRYLYTYNINGAMTKQEYREDGKVKVSYDYGEIDNLQTQTFSIGSLQYKFRYINVYDVQNNRIERSEISSGASSGDAQYKEIGYDYTEEGQLSEMTYDGYTAKYAYDQGGGLDTRNSLYNNTSIQNERYIYRTFVKNGVTYTTNQLSRIDDRSARNNDSISTYDTNGRVSAITSNNNTHTYAYDAMGRLSSENSTTYTYDSNGNITQRNNNGSVTNYIYDSQGRLIQAGSQYFEYDSMGNPTLYKGNAFTWEQGRKLANGTLNGNTFAYDYDGNGMRYKKVVNGETTEYYLNGTQILMENRDGIRIYYIYGVTGVEGMIYDEDYYYFDKNTLGDVIGIRNSSGTLVATYEYDAWGNITYQYGSMADINPFRYRGYYYDTETGFYYLQTRYYDPSICRFINADNYELISQLASSKELNMYVYCRNNPIMYTDSTGESLLEIIAVGVLLALTISDIVMIASSKTKAEVKNGEVEIKGSHLVNTPWVQWGYSFYLNHISSGTKDIIQGTTAGVQGEWAAHNIGYYLFSIGKMGADLFGCDNSTMVRYMGAASPANIGATVFNNPSNSYISTGLIAYNIITNPIATLIDYYLVYKRG